MTSVKNFEDLDIWKESKTLSVQVYSIFKNHTDFGFRDQIQRASISVMNNTAEGFERKSDKEFIRFLKIAKGSSGEVRSMLWIAIEIDYLNEDIAKDMIEKYYALSSKIGRLINYLSKS